MISINSFGFGSANVHAVLKANSKRTYAENSSRAEIRLAVVCARTSDGCQHMLNRLKEYQNSVELQALVAENAPHPPHTHPYRGFALLNSPDSSITIKVFLLAPH
jgi:acyl transferase domain-containing protein